MKIPVQFTPALTAALLCAGIWYAFWLLAFRPAPLNRFVADTRPEVVRFVTGDETLRKLKTPTLFALPSSEGFSGQFLDNQVALSAPPEKINSAARYLPRENAAAPAVDRALLAAETVLLSQSALPVPGAVLSAPVRPPSGIQLFLSPELKLRTNSTLQLNIASAGLPETVRVNLTVRPDGTVEHALFETPVTDAALLSAVRQLHFKPAAEQTESWMDIRYVQEEK